MRGLCYFFLSLLTQVSSSTFKVFGFYGDNVTLPCEYDYGDYGVLDFCWGRGTVPMTGCSDPVLSSQGGTVVSRQSSRFQLAGRVVDGDTSLTIINAQRGDAGDYGCRVEIPGWFNDLKVDIELIMTEAPEEPHDEDWSIITASPQEILTSTPKTEEFEVATFYFVEASVAEEKFKAFFEVGNIARMASIFLFTIIVILFFIFRKRFRQRKELQTLSSSAADNVYESIPALM